MFQCCAHIRRRRACFEDGLDGQYGSVTDQKRSVAADSRCIAVAKHDPDVSLSEKEHRLPHAWMTPEGPADKQHNKPRKHKATQQPAANRRPPATNQQPATSTAQHTTHSKQHTRKTAYHQQHTTHNNTRNAQHTQNNLRLQHRSNTTNNTPQSAPHAEQQQHQNPQT